MTTKPQSTTEPNNDRDIARVHAINCVAYQQGEQYCSCGAIHQPHTLIEKGEPVAGSCQWCDKGDRAHFLDADGTLVSITGNDGVLCHAHEEYWWPCMRFGVEIRSARISSVSAPPVADNALDVTDLLPSDEKGRICECRCHGYHEVRRATCPHCAGDNSEGPTGCLDDGDALSEALRQIPEDRLNEILSSELKTGDVCEKCESAIVQAFKLISEAINTPASAAPVVDALCTALETAINSVECSSVDSDTREELPWYKQAHEALRLAGRPWKGICHE